MRPMRHAQSSADDSAIPENFRLSAYRYELPDERIARRPAERRDGSRLLVVDRRGPADRVAEFVDLPSILHERFPQGGLVVANNSRVFPARIFGHRASGGQVEALLLTPLPLLHVKPASSEGWREAEAEALLRGGRRMKKGEAALFDDDLTMTLIERGDFGRCQVLLRWRGDLHNIFNRIGHMPLPPYLERADDATDRERYQTTYASDHKAGSVAAPTAGLHITDGVRNTLKSYGFEWAEVTLYVGYGTFSPVREADIREHRMHAEYVEVPEETAQAIGKAKAAGKPVICVGTTSARSLEGMFAATGEVRAFQGETDIYILPGKSFHVVDALITNFHLPESSLLIMVSTLAGRERIRSAYALALAEGFRFFSYGDAMLIL